MTYQYKYVRLEFHKGFTKNTLAGHREIIDKHAENGWRFVAMIPTKNIGYGSLAEIDLVFEKEAERK